jgi:drug/metabolite transporter (DMT)-like permease
VTSQKQVSWDEFLPYLKVTFSVVVWGASFVATKIALRDLQPVTVVWVRFAIGVIVLGVVVLVRKQLKLPQRAEIAYFAVLGFLGITLHQWLQSTGLVIAKASTTAWIVATTPLFIAILSWLFLREKLIWAQIAGIGLATIGVFLVISEGDISSLAIGEFGNYGDFLILISAMNWAVFSVISRRGLEKHPAALMMFYAMVAGWLMISIPFITRTGVNDLQSISFGSLLGVLFLGIFCSGIGYIFWYDALKAIPAPQVGVFLYLEPLVAVILAAILLGENIFLASLVGGILILIGVWMVNQLSAIERNA